MEGDVIEAGCFMGGTAVFMRAGDCVSTSVVVVVVHSACVL